MKNFKTFGIILLSLVMMFGITGCFETDDDGDGDTITVAISASQFANAKLYFMIMESGVSPDPTTALFLGELDLDGNGEESLVSGTLFDTGTTYDIYALIDPDGDSTWTTGPNYGDYQAGPIDVDGGETLDLVYGDFTATKPKLEVTIATGTDVAIPNATISIFTTSVAIDTVDVSTAMFTSPAGYSTSTFTFEDKLSPGVNYYLLAWDDENQNGVFDTGEAGEIKATPINLSGDDSHEFGAIDAWSER